MRATVADAHAENPDEESSHSRNSPLTMLSVIIDTCSIQIGFEEDAAPASMRCRWRSSHTVASPKAAYAR